MDVKRLILFVVLSFSILFFWNAWQEKHRPIEPIATTQDDIPTKTTIAAVDKEKETQFRLQTDKRISVQTDLFKAEIDTMGADLRKLELTQHRAANSNADNFVLLSDQIAPSVYVIQSGIAIDGLATHKEVFTSATNSYQMAADQNELKVSLEWLSTQARIKMETSNLNMSGEITITLEAKITPAAPPTAAPITNDQSL